MEKICDLDIGLHRCVTPDIQTSEVIITEERIRHIRERHPGDFERFSIYLRELIVAPDYIIADSRPHTAMVLKQIEEDGEKIRLSLRLVTPADPPAYKNSVLTFMKIRPKEWRRVIDHRKILYKSE